MRRREFIGGLGSAAAWPITVQAQRRAIPVIGFLSGASEAGGYAAAFRRGLSEEGYVEGRNVILTTGRSVYTVALRQLVEQRAEWSWAAIQIVEKKAKEI